ncbi:MAG: response regulator, partial [Desulfovibrionaceae bacterium]|nr:response regulator [Desulfovibrionaceae bacterium]
YGYEVLTAENGEQGIEVFSREHPPLVLTDIKMPGMDGIEVLKRIKEADHSTEVIVITGHGDMDLAIEALNLDATDFINTPIQRHTLEQALKRAQERILLAKSKEGEVTVNEVGRAAVINIRGNVTSRSEPYLLEAYEKAEALGRDAILLHFDDAASINGAGIAVLTQILLKGRKKGHKLAITGLSDNFRRVVEIVGITKLVNIYDTVDEALEGLEG